MNTCRWFLSLLLIASSLMQGVAFAEETPHTKDTLEQVQKKLRDGEAVLLDVREPSEWAEGHLKDARLLSLSQIRKGVPKEDLDKLMPKGKVLYAHCFAGKRCLEAAERLKAMGYEIRPLKPGYPDLLKAGFPKADP
jgi:phage shock protein E